MHKQTSSVGMVRVFFIAIIWIALVYGQTSTPQSGTLILKRNGVYSQSFNSGRVVVYGVGSPTSSTRFWGNVCRRTAFNTNAAHVICHQLTYSGASTWSYAAIDSFGIDANRTLLKDVSCSSSRYLMLFQCSVSTLISNLCSDNDDISVTCYTSRIWSTPYAGQIRLTSGNYTNEGLLEVYCNGVWGTVCDNTFSSTAATIVCKQLGYNQYYQFNRLPIVGTATQSIWLNSLSCRSSYSCLSSCQSCPSSASTACVHAEDVTVVCYSSSVSRSTSNTESTCQISSTTESGGLSGGAIAGIVIGSIIGVGLIVAFIAHLDRKKKERERALAAQKTANIVQLTSAQPVQENPVNPVTTTTAVPPPEVQPEVREYDEKTPYPSSEPNPEPSAPAPYAPPPPFAPAPYPPTNPGYPAYPPTGYYPPNPYPDSAYPPTSGAYPPATYPSTDGRPEPPPYNETAYPPAPY